MISPHNRLVHGFPVAVVLLSLGLLCSCKLMRTDPREDLIRSLRGANVEGFQFATKEDGAEEIASLTNSAVRNLIKLDDVETNLVLRYTRISDKATNTARTYKTEIAKEGTALTLLVTDIGTNEVVSRDTFPAAATKHANGFDSLEDCLREFDCVNRGPLQCEANRTCKDQFAAITCCLKNGQCFSVHLIIRPTTLRCKLREVIPDLEGLVLSQ